MTMLENTLIARYYSSLNESKGICGPFESMIEFLQNDTFFHLAIAKEARKTKLRTHFSSGGFNGRIFLTRKTLGRVELDFPGVVVEHVDIKDLLELVGSALLEGAIVISSNNDIVHDQSLETYRIFFSKTENSIVAVWDLDDHHWCSLSTFLAAHSDIYFPAHLDNFYALSRYNRTIAGPVSCGVLQWSTSFLEEHFDDIIFSSRSDKPLGAHMFYEKFKFRNQIITTLAGHYETVGFSTQHFHQLTVEDRLKVWQGHKAHWIVPVLNDIPTRLFDALATGGVPIVPNTLKHYREIEDILEHLVFYDASDIVSPQGVVDQANEKFDQGGINMLVKRHKIGTREHHASARVGKIIQTIFSEFGIITTE